MVIFKTLKDIPKGEELLINYDVYYKIYREARTKAKEAKKQAILALLEAKNIKKTYMLDKIDGSDEEIDDEIDNISESELFI